MRNLKQSLFILVGLGGAASANGFYINEHDTKVTGRAGAAVATDTDPSSIVFNPGGLAVGEGTAFTIGASVISAMASYTTPDGQSTDTNGSPAVLPAVMVSHRFNDLFAAGIAFHLPFGLAVSWPDSSPQAGVVTKQSLRTYFISPTIGFNLHKLVPGLSVGAGFDIVPSTVQLEQNLYFGSAQGSAVLGGDAIGFGQRIGVMYRPEAEKRLSFGLAWKSQVDLAFSGKGDFDLAEPYRDQLPPDGNIATDLKLPMSIAGGVAFRPTPELEVEANAVWINWKKFATIDIVLPDGTHSVQPQDYKNTVTIRLGGEYKINPKAAVRAGYIYDPTPVPDTTISARLPDINRHDVTLGGTYAVTPKIDVNLAGLLVIPGSNEASTADPYMPAFKGKYDVTALVFSAGLTGRL